MKKITSFGMTLFLSFAIVACGPKMEGPEPPTGPDTKWYVGHESNASFSLDNANQLAGLAELVNGGVDFNGKTITLTRDIDLSTFSISTRASATTNWIPIGTYDHPFRGTFNGNNKKITGLFINDETLDDAGLFGRITRGKVQNVGVELAQGGITAGAFVGAVAGILNGGSVDNCYAVGNVSGSSYVGGVVGRIDDDLTLEPIGSITNCYATGNVVGIGNYVGGVIGIIYGDITNCYATGSVNSTGNYVGGVVGRAHPFNSIKNCYATGSIGSDGNWVGGVVGGAFGPIEDCVALNPSVSGGSFVGRVAGMGGGTNNAAWEEMTVNGAIVGTGNATNQHGANVSTAMAKTVAFWTDTMGWSVSDWNISAGNYPTLK